MNLYSLVSNLDDEVTAKALTADVADAIGSAKAATCTKIAVK